MRIPLEVSLARGVFKKPTALQSSLISRKPGFLPLRSPVHTTFPSFCGQAAVGKKRTVCRLKFSKHRTQFHILQFNVASFLAFNLEIDLGHVSYLALHPSSVCSVQGPRRRNLRSDSIAFLLYPILFCHFMPLLCAFQQNPLELSFNLATSSNLPFANAPHSTRNL